MFESLEDLATRLTATGYFIDSVMTQVIFLAAKLKKPLLLEGPAGSGKTQLALSVAAAANTHVERLQCYRGVTEAQAMPTMTCSQRWHASLSRKVVSENLPMLYGANCAVKELYRP
jgi:cytidylate kinase